MNFKFTPEVFQQALGISGKAYVGVFVAAMILMIVMYVLGIISAKTKK
ncbi:MAG: hypothetical protein IJC53_01690 [Clostridia bacterium]|nr:hypothetical protein [Clostridia bacterium]MBR6557037.1 hypothetical protein [Clostridia bacterium]